jgi:predicted PurR-regulated permease PerM
MNAEGPSSRAIFRTVAIVVIAALSLYVIYLLRKPIGWVVIAAFIAVAMSGPVSLLQRRMKRGLAIGISYFGLILVPIILGVLLVPSLVNQAEDLAQNVPEYAKDVTKFVNDNETLSDINDEFDVTSEIEKLAADLPSKIGDAAGVLRDIGVGFVNSVFAGVTILILSIFMLGGGPRWIAGFVRTQPADRAQRIDRALAHMSRAIGNYVGGVLLQASIAAVAAFIVLKILGAPFAGPLALAIFFFDLIPLVGATIAAIIVAIVMLFVNFPVGVIVWIVYAIVYQQIENYVIQPRIQSRATAVEPFVVLLAVLFGGTLFGIIGAILAIPAAASIQIAIREYVLFRRESAQLAGEAGEPAAASGPTGGGTGPAGGGAGPAEAPA